MRPGERVVVSLPLERLWAHDGDLAYERLESLDREGIRRLLRDGPVRFVVADVGRPLRWVPDAERFQFWKGEASVRITGTDPVFLESFPDGFAYRASKWSPADGTPVVVLLEVHH